MPSNRGNKKKKTTSKKKASLKKSTPSQSALSRKSPSREEPSKSPANADPAAAVSHPQPDDTPLHRMHLWQFQAVRDLLLFVAIVGIIWLGYALRPVTVPLLVALLLAYLFEPLVQWLVKHKRMSFDRLQAVTMILIIFVGSVLILLALVLPLVIGQATQLVRNYNDGTLHSQIIKLDAYIPDFLREEFQGVVNILPQDASTLDITHIDREASTEADFDTEGHNASNDAESTDTPNPLETRAADTTQEGDLPIATGDDSPPDGPISEARLREIIAEEVAIARAREDSLADAKSGDLPVSISSPLSLAGRGARTISNIIGSIIAWGLLAFLIPFYFFFFSLSYPAVIRFGRSLIPEKNKSRTLELIGKMDYVVASFVRGRIVIAAIMGAMLALGWLICGVPFAIVLGVVVGFFSLVPYLGGIGLPIAVGLVFFDYLGTPVEDRSYLLGFFGVVLWPSLVFVLVQMIEGYVLTPKIAGKATNLDPVTIVVAVLAGGSLLGVYGMLLAIPIAACGKILITEVIAPHVNAWLKGERRDPLPFGGAEPRE